ncbi:MAG: peptidoglycan DD-metalloendopeptidase family protein [Deltaproteobacteria bacterium]|nr:peptidoglycan DD-metalloendopeptidase family protein [Deltaproteobacteria bacterium]MBK8718717.1 peptidoglycan DD-metalloendopeptidase family protein [Deltaproteobacteria bacterium]MBP7290966.1 peptidoglycan DD-metalloendopeptidase family protein [Nannocystaceae bacterium]
MRVPAAEALLARGGVDGAGGPADAAADNAQVAAQFETLLLGELVKAMRQSASVTGDDGGFATGTYQEMFDQAIVDASAGGLGLRDAIARQLGGGAPSSASAERAGPHPLPPRIAHAFAGASTGLPLHDPAPVMKRGVAAPAYAGDIGTAFEGGTPSPGLFPVDGGVQSSGYGFRVHPIHGDRRFHGGLDIAAPEGREIRAVQRGVVIRAERHKGYGNMVEIRHPDGVVTRYAHASKLYVREGDAVDVGETIADVGSTGQSTGPHLHFEVRDGGRTLDPHAYLERLRAAGDDRGAARSRTGITVDDDGRDRDVVAAATDVGTHDE